MPGYGGGGNGENGKGERFEFDFNFQGFFSPTRDGNLKWGKKIGEIDPAALSLTVYVPDGECDFPPELLLVELHAHNLVGEPLVEEPVDLGAARQLQGVDGGGTAALDGALKVLLESLDTPAEENVKCEKRWGGDARVVQHSLEHGLCLDGWVVRPEVLVLLHLLLQGEVHLLQSVPQPGEGLADVVRQLLVQHLLQVGRAQAVGHVAVGRVAQEELPLGRHGSLDVLLAVDVLLRPVDHSDVSPPEREELVLQDVLGVSSLVHQIQLCQHADGAESFLGQ